MLHGLAILLLDQRLDAFVAGEDAGAAMDTLGRAALGQLLRLCIEKSGLVPGVVRSAFRADTRGGLIAVLPAFSTGGCQSCVWLGSGYLSCPA